MKIETAITHEKIRLILKAEKGIYENFGQKEVREIEDKYIDNAKYTSDMNRRRLQLSEFDEWCMNYIGKE